DAGQQAIVEAWKLIKADAVDSLDSRWAWLILVARNKARTIRRQHRRWRAIASDAAVAMPLVAREDENEPVHFALVRSAFDRLPHRLQEVFTFVCLEGNSYRAAAAQFGVSPGIISRRLGKAREQLRTELCSLPEFRARAETTNRQTAANGSQ